MVIKWLKWTQLVVAVATTILSGLIFPGAMVVIVIAIGVFYIVSAAGAFRDWKPFIWSACLLSLGVAGLSTNALVADDFAVFRIESEMGDPPMVVVSPGGDVIELDDIPGSSLANMRRDYDSVVRRQRVVAVLLLLVSIGSCAAVLMHTYAWKWLVLGKIDHIR